MQELVVSGIQLSTEDFDIFSSNEKGAEGHLEWLDNQLIELKRQVRQVLKKLSAIAWIRFNNIIMW